MYIINNALKNLWRNKDRNLLLAIIIFVLILSTTIALIINATTKEIIDDYKTRFGSKVTLGVNFEQLMVANTPDEEGVYSFAEAPKIETEQYVDFADSKLLKSYQMDMTTGVVFDNLKAVNESDNNGMIGGIGEGYEDYVSPKAKLIGYSDVKNLPDFADGLREMHKGRFYKAKNECIVSMDFAKLNKLKVNDTFTTTDSSNTSNVTLKIVGIYADATKAERDLPQGAMSLQSSYENRRNEILVGLNTMKDNFNVNNLFVNVEYELKSPDLVKDFEKEIREKGLPDAFFVETDEAGYQKIVNPVVKLSSISMTFMWVILAIGIIILLFVTTMAIRERKYEIGVLRAMGMKKAKVAVMLVAEMIIITTLCLGVGLGIGSMLSQPVADALIAGQVETEDNSPQIGMSNGSISIGMEESDVEPLTEIEVSLTADAVIKITLVALMLALLSSGAGVIFITKYEPMKILSERN